ncbi:hypothetical protein HDU96_010992 [Phlyctochytrium bullatum]|nr:hypothetical protein HDU96_010992 [Phlyctochytrium bullatum]
MSGTSWKLWAWDLGVRSLAFDASVLFAWSAVRVRLLLALPRVAEDVKVWLAANHILIPAALDETSEYRNAAEKLASDSDKEAYVAELRELAKQLYFEPNIHLITLKNYRADIDTIPLAELVFNLCDGCDVDGLPGPCVAEYLEEKKFENVVGSDFLFINNTLTKNGMKRIFRDHLVSTPLGFPVTRTTDLESEVSAWGVQYPLFVKVSDSYGSVGLDEGSVVHGIEELRKRVELLLKEFEELTVEEFIEGQEFSVLISGNCRDENQPVIVYPPAERAFAKDLPVYQRFITFKSNWNEEFQLHQYAKVVDENDAVALQDLARRAYIATSGNCFGRVDIRKRDSSGKFYVLEVNASCGVGTGSSSDFILKLAGQSTQDFFKILLSNFLQPPPLLEGESRMSMEPAVEEGLAVIPPSVEEEVTELLKNPNLAVLPTPVVHVIVAAVMLDAEAGTVDPSGKLVHTFGKDVAYQSELETIFRTIGYDPIVHIHNYDDVNEALSSLTPESDLIFNCCLGQDGAEVAQMVAKLGFRNVVGLNARFFEESRDRERMHNMLVANSLPVPAGVTLGKGGDWESELGKAGIGFPVYVKPVCGDTVDEGLNAGGRVESVEALRELLAGVAEGERIRVEEFIEGTEYRVLVAGDARDPTSDVIVFPPALFAPTHHVGFSGALLAPLRGTLFRRPTLPTLAPSAPDATVGPLYPATRTFRPLRPDEVFLDMDLRDLARRAFTAVHGSCYGLCTIIDRNDASALGLEKSRGGLMVIGVSADVRFGEKSKCGTLLKLANQNVESLFSWLIRRPVRA